MAVSYTHLDVYKRQRLTNTCEAEQQEQREAMERSLTRDEERIEVLDKMVMRPYEDMICLLYTSRCV